MKNSVLDGISFSIAEISARLSLGSKSRPRVISLRRLVLLSDGVLSSYSPYDIGSEYLALNWTILPRYPCAIQSIMV